MKNLLFLLTICLSSFMTWAQPNKYAQSLMITPVVAFDAQQVTFNETSHPALTYIIHSDADDFLKDWKKMFETKYMIEGKRSSGYTACMGVRVANWSLDSLNLYYKTEKEADATRMYLMIEKGGKFLAETDDMEMFAKVKVTLKQHAKDFYLKQYEMHIADQQKQYDGQVKDMEKLRKQEEKFNKIIADHNSSKAKADENIRETNAKLAESRNEIRTHNTALELNKKAVVQAEKEVSTQNELIKAKEVEYTQLNNSGSLNTKSGKKVMKELEKGRAKMEKLRATLTDAGSEQTKTENEIIKAEQGEAKLQSKMTEMNAAVDKHDAEINASKAELDKTAQDIKDKQRLIDEAKNLLDKLQAAKAGLATM